MTCGEPGIPTAAVRLLDAEGNLHIAAATGTGPVDAAFKAIDSIVGPSLPAPHRLAEYAVQAVTAGIDAIGEVHVRVDAGTRVFLGRSGTTDIVVASARAYLDALNRLIAAGPAVLEARQTPEEMAAHGVVTQLTRRGNPASLVRGRGELGRQRSWLASSLRYTPLTVRGNE